VIHDLIQHLARPIGDLRPHPENPRRGDVDAIKESLEVNGQYKPILVQASTMFILGGNHTWLAAKRLGWDEIAAVLLDVDDAEATRILLADNRHADLATDDTNALTELLQTLPSLDGTGWGQDDMDRMLRDLARPLTYDDPPPAPEGMGTGTPPDGEGEEPGDPTPPVAMIDAPDFKVELQPGSLAEWAKEFKGKKGQAKLAELLTWPDGSGPPRLSRPGDITRVGTGTGEGGVGEQVPLDELNPYPLNPRQGDVGAISESLAANGQFRPIVVNKGTITGAPNEILAGNHTFFGARAIGWQTIGVTWVDVDATEAARILLADNRTAELGSYNTDLLVQSLQSLDSLAGTGFDYDDLDDFLAASSDVAGATRKGKARLRIIDEDSATAYTLSTLWPLYDGWYADLEARASQTGTNPAGLVADLLSLTSARAQ